MKSQERFNLIETSCHLVKTASFETRENGQTQILFIQIQIEVNKLFAAF